MSDSPATGIRACLFEPTADPRLFRCDCGARASRPTAVHYPCPLARGPLVSEPISAAPPLMPSLARSALHLAGAAAAFVADGFARVSEPARQTRLAICRTCDQLSGDRCAQCGCFMSAKAGIRSQACPLGKWPAAGE